MTKIIFSLDTEDYVNEAAADGIIRASRIIREAGARPCHNVVARLAEALIKWGRKDCIDEIKKCEIATHSLAHSHHPTINEYTDLEDFGEAMRIFRLHEDEGTAILSDILGVEEFAAACPPGLSTSYVGIYGYADMGIKVYDGSTLGDKVKNRPIHFCNMLGILYNDRGLDNFGSIEKDAIDDMIEYMAGYDYYVCCHHPAMNTVDTFCDLLNFFRENVPEDKWVMSPLYPPENLARFEENLRYFLEKLKADGRFEFTTYTELANEYCYPRKISLSDIPAIKKELDEDWFPLTMPESLCLADVMLACRDFLLGKTEHDCGKVYGFLQTPYAVDVPVTLKAADIRSAASAVKDGEFLPTELSVGGVKIGPADFIRAALAVLTGEETVTVEPKPWQIDLSEFPSFNRVNYKGTWVHTNEFEDRYVSERGRLQSYTVRLPKGTARRVF